MSLPISNVHKTIRVRPAFSAATPVQQARAQAARAAHSFVIKQQAGAPVSRTQLARSAQLQVAAPTPAPAQRPKEVAAIAGYGDSFRVNAKASTPNPFGEEMRPGFTLQLSEDKLFKGRGANSEEREGAMFFFTNTKGNYYHTPKNVFWSWASALCALAEPGVEQVAPEKVKLKRGNYARPMAQMTAGMTQRGDFANVRVKPVTDGYIVSVPILNGSNFFWQRMMEIFSGVDVDNAYPVLDPKFAKVEGTLSGEEAESFKNRCGLETRFYTAVEVYNACRNAGPEQIWTRNVAGGGVASRQFARIPNAGFEVKRTDTRIEVRMRLFFTKRQIECLTQTDWLLVRPLDVFNVFHTWAKTRYNTAGKTPKYFISLKEAQARLLPLNKAVPRLSAEGITIDHQGVWWKLPEAAPSVSTVDGQFIRYLQRDDGSFGYPTNEDLARGSVASPPNEGLVLLDWANLKLVYVGTHRTTITHDLSRATPATATHYAGLLKSKVMGSANSILAQCENIAQDVFGRGMNDSQKRDFIPYGHALALSLSRPFGGGQHNPNEDQPPTLITWMDFAKYYSYTAAGLYWMNLIHEILDFAETDIDNLYSRYSFSTVSNLLAYLTVIAKVGPSRGSHVLQEAYEELAPYQDRAPDPNFTPPPVPYVEDGRALQPHQARTASRLVKKPKFAILAVDAGGGKTITAIYDFLFLLGEGDIKRGLFMCPAHLVAQYVKEFLYMTGARVNVIAVCADTLATHGIDRLIQMIETAPPNTVVVVDYHLTNSVSKRFRVGFGADPTQAYPLVDALRQVRFDYLVSDESHYLKNLSTGAARAVARLTAEIPYKRLMSGTLSPDRIDDLVAQVNLLDPTIFPPENFKSTYYIQDPNGEEGDMVWDRARIRRDLENRCQFIQVKRKEWAAWLPPITESMNPDSTDRVRMTPQQQQIYNSILADTIAELKKQAESDATIRDILSGKEVFDDDEDGGPDEDADTGLDKIDVVVKERPQEGLTIERALSKSLARLENFVADPTSDILGGQLTGEDAVPPKTRHLAKVLDNHFAQEAVNEAEWNRVTKPRMLADGASEKEATYRMGKVIIFCNYHIEAAAVFRNLPDRYRSHTVAYEASNKVEDVAKFEEDPNMWIMVGIQSSMNTGLNLQCASHLIRLGVVWTPGALEQGNARIQRPNLKSAETRAGISVTWLLCENSIDILKQTLLFSKIISIGKFEEVGTKVRVHARDEMGRLMYDSWNNPIYEVKTFDELPEPPDVKMSLELLMGVAEMDSEDPTVAATTEQYQNYRKLQLAVFAEYKSKNLAEAGPDGRPIMKPLSRGENQEHAKLMYRLPYVAGSDVYAASELGLVRYDKFLKLEEYEISEDAEKEEASDSADKKAAKRARLQAQADVVVGRAAHCEFGEGVIHRVTAGNVFINLADGERKIVPKMATYIITRAQTDAVDMREAMFKLTGDIAYDSVPQRAKVPVKDLRVKRRALKTYDEWADDGDGTPPAEGDAPALPRPPKKVLKVYDPWADDDEGTDPDAQKDEAQPRPGNQTTRPRTSSPRSPSTVTPRKPSAPKEDEEIILNTRPPKDIQVKLDIIVMADVIGLQMSDAEANPQGAAFLEAKGFSAPIPHYYTEFALPAHFKGQFFKWAEDGFQVHPAYSAACRDVYLVFSKKGARYSHWYGVSTQQGIKNFFRLNIKPVNDPKIICPYPLLQGKSVGCVLPITNHPGSAQAVRHAYPGVVWKKVDVQNQRQMFFTRVSELNDMLGLISEDADLIDMQGLIRQFKDLHSRNAVSNVPGMKNAVMPKAVRR